MWLAQVVALALAGAAVAAGPASAQSPAGDSVVGSGYFGSFFEVSIQAGPSGENPTGFLRLNGANASFEAEPTCLNVAGNVAVAAYRIVSGDLAGGGFVAEIVDNGPPVGMPVDVVTYYDAPFEPPASCPAPIGGPGTPLISGDVTVVDAVPGPTNAEQCRRGGWEQFGFRNQGQCIAAVRRPSSRGT